LGDAILAPLACISAICRSWPDLISLRIHVAVSCAALVIASRSAGDSFCQVFSEIVSGIGL
jgi:hypothetical protein